jgi:DMSO reductase family type II enzyme heme b subunit
MIARKVTAGETALRSPGSTLWSAEPGTAVDLMGTPIGLQPSPYVMTSWAQENIGRVGRLRVKSAHNGKEIAFHLEWEDRSRETALTDTNVFPDGAGLLFPLVADAPLITMGAEAQPVNAWHWRADRPGHARSNVARGLGTTQVTDESSITADATWEDGRWRLVFARALQVSPAKGDAIQFSVGETTQVAFAVWEGGNGERGGIKAFSPNWLELVPQA